MKLLKIKNTLQQIAEAISSVIEIDVTITDRNLVRIAGTGKYKDQIGESISRDGVFASCLRDNRAYIVENPKHDKVCQNCSCKDICIECAEIVTPINVDGEAEGTIGLIAFDQSQKKRLLKNETNVLMFLRKMSEMIASTLIEKERSSEIKILANQLHTIMDIMDKGIIIVDGIGDIKYTNKVADNLLEITSQKFKNIQEIINHTNLSSFNLNRKLDNKEFEFKHKNGNFTSGTISTKILEDENEVQSVVIIIQEIQRLIKSARNIISANIATPFDNIIYKSSIMEETVAYAKKTANSDSTVLITGESGTGKELFARAIHYHSDRKKEPFIAINCSAIPENLFESELFGYSEGAFTGASKGGHPGKFELANRGTLLLDEIGDMPLHLQPKLLRVIQDGKVTRIGGSRQIDVDVRIIASTNVNLEQKVKNKEFREDLYYRLNVIPLHIPSLRERGEDIELISEYFLEKYSKKLSKKVKNIDLEAMYIIRSHIWKGNVRELQNTIEYAVNMAEGSSISKKDLPPRFQTLDSKPYYSEKTYNDEACRTENHEKEIKISKIEDLEKQEILRALEYKAQNNITIEEVCRLLGIGKATFYRKCKTYNI